MNVILNSYEVKTFKKGEVFEVQESPEHLFLLFEGSAAITHKIHGGDYFLGTVLSGDLLNARSLSGHRPLPDAVKGIIVFTSIFIFLLFISKLAMLNLIPALKDFPSPYYLHSIKEHGTTYTLVNALVYLVSTPFQQIIFRSTMQVPLNDLIEVKGKAIISILITTILFSCGHLPYGISIALIMLVPGLFLAVMFQRQKSLLGVSLSHGILALWTELVGGEFHIINILSPP